MTKKMPKSIFLEYQKKWVKDKSTTKLHAKSRRIGGTWGEAADDTLYAASEGMLGGDVIYIGFKKEMASEFIEDCAKFAEIYEKGASAVEEDIFNDKDKDILTFVIRFASGYKIEALTSSPRSLRGKGKNRPRVVIDEAAFHDDLPGLIKAAIALKIWGASIRFISSHNGVDNPFNLLLEDIKAGRRPGTVHEVDFDQAIADGLYKRVCLASGIEWTPEGEKKWRDEIVKEYGDDADEELFCIPSEGEGAFFSRPLIKNNMKKDIPVVFWSQKDDWAELPDRIREKECQEWLEETLKPLLDDLDPKRHTWFGEDFARIQNLTVIWPVQEKEDSNLRVPFAVELFNIPFRQQEQILFYIVDKLPRFVGGAMDARGNGQALAEYAMQRYGSDRIHMIMLTEKWYSRWFPDYKKTLEDRGIDIPASADVMADHRAVKKVKGVPKIVEVQKSKEKNQKKSKKKRHGDSAIAGVMAIYAVNEIEYIEEFEVAVAMPLQTASMFKGY
ncbi:MAG: hypothetical protein GY760_02165 [Deltaproteobacteria bacterium]|nr:hypothetical protein [Deltaproteobacteria bacterium]